MSDRMEGAARDLGGRVQETVGHLEAERDFSNALLERFPDGLAVVGPGARVSFANPAFRWVFPSPAWDEPSPRLADVVSSRGAVELLESAYYGRAPLLRERLELHPPEHPRDLSLRLSVVPVGAPASERALVVVEDETARERDERERSEWQDMLIHDVKSPLSAVLGTTKALRMSPRPPEEDRLLAHAEKAGERIVALLNTYLDVLRMESGAFRLSGAPLALAEAAEEAAAQVEPLAREAGMEMSVDVPPGAQVTGDRDLVVRMLVNLLDNAVKYGASGKRASVRAEAAGGGGWKVTVHDDGPGIPPADLPRVFERYYRAPSPGGGRKGGTGLGLAFCRLAAQLHGWSIRAESGPGRGTDMVVETRPAGRTPA
ncbi:MAG: HAMP domain-containing histidine kinase [Elusimicrobia bacterium]|nr:HAMP domain-containing histidine kinase [Elusimicrobiota bacterium]